MLSLISFLWHVHVKVAADIQQPDRAMHATALAARDINSATGRRLALVSAAGVPVVPWADIFPIFEPEGPHLYRLVGSLPPSPGKHDITLYLISPQRNVYGQEHPTGAAQDICARGPTFAYATIVTGGYLSEQRARYAIEHELLHLLGAEHVTGRNVMSPGNFEYVSEFAPRLKIAKRTARQVLRCGKEVTVENAKHGPAPVREGPL